MAKNDNASPKEASSSLNSNDRQTLDLIRELAEVLNDSSLSEIELETKNGNNERLVRVTRQSHSSTGVVSPYPIEQQVINTAPAAHMPAAPPAQATPVSTNDTDLTNSQRSPMVGTAYLSSEPGKPPFVEEGLSVKEGDTLFIIEAMKVMNPILAEKSGTVRQILIENEQAVEFDQPLIIID